MQGPAIRPRLVIFEARADVSERWRSAFAGLEDASFVAAAARFPCPAREVDAWVAPGMVAHERVGGRPQHGVAQVLPARGHFGAAAWVVTTPPQVLPLAVAFQRLGAGRPLGAKVDVCAEFAVVFRAVRDFKADSGEPIGSLAMDLEMLFFDAASAAEDALAVRDAYEAVFPLHLD